MADLGLSSTLLGADPEADEILSELRSTGPEGRPATQPAPSPSVAERIGQVLSGPVAGALEDISLGFGGKPPPVRERNVQTLDRLEALYNSLATQGAGASVLEPVVKNLRKGLVALDPKLAFSDETERFLIESPSEGVRLLDEEFEASLPDKQKPLYRRLVLKNPKLALEMQDKFYLQQLHADVARIQANEDVGYREAFRKAFLSKPKYAGLREAAGIEAPPELPAGKVLDVTESRMKFALEQGYSAEEAEQFTRTGVLPAGPTPKAGQAAQSAKALQEAREAAAAASKSLAAARSGTKPPTFNELTLMVQRLAKAREALEFSVGIPEEERLALIDDINSGIGAVGGMLREIGERRGATKPRAGKFSSADEVKRAVRQKRISREEGLRILKEQFRYTD